MTEARLAYRVDPLPGCGEPPPVEVALSPASLSRWVEPLFPDYRVEPAGGDPDVELRETGARFRVRGASGGALPDLPRAVAALETSLAEALLRSAEPAVALHGAAVEFPWGALLLTGPGGGGKSSLTAGLALRGHRIHGDDVVLVDPGTGEVRPFKRLVKVSPGARRALDLPDPPEPLDRLWDDAHYHPDALGSGWAGPGRVRAAVLPERPDDGAEASLLPVSGGASVREVLLQLLFREGRGSAEFDLAVRLLDGARLHRLRFSRSDRAVALLEEALGLDPGGPARPGAGG